jgi:beta-glucanase (GH16 family)
MWIQRFFLLVFGALGLLERTGVANEGEVSPAPPLEDYVLVWHDEFDGDTLDETKWNHSRLGPRRDAVNVKDAISLDGEGHLHITTSRHVRDDGTIEYRTGMLDTHGKLDTTGGYFEARMKLQTQVGHWSAFWLQTPTMGQPLGDPATAGTEIDIMEYLCNGRNRGRVHHTLHWDGYGEHHKSAHTLVDAPHVTEGFHTFGLLWTGDEYVFFIDGKETWRTDQAVSKRDQYMLLSLEVGKWAGDIAEAELPDALIVDYVRVFKPRSESEERSEPKRDH